MRAVTCEVSPERGAGEQCERGGGATMRYDGDPGQMGKRKGAGSKIYGASKGELTVGLGSVTREWRGRQRT